MNCCELGAVANSRRIVGIRRTTLGAKFRAFQVVNPGSFGQIGGEIEFRKKLLVRGEYHFPLIQGFC